MERLIAVIVSPLTTLPMSMRMMEFIQRAWATNHGDAA
jgi:hypothetical protein